ncbi:putative pterin-binding protein [Actibacterium sp. D379-3]
MLEIVKKAAAVAIFTLPLMALASGQAFAETPPAPTSEVVLTISGEISATDPHGTAMFDLEMLQHLPTTEFSTATIWTDGVHRFTGVLLTELLDTVGADGRVLRATAINDYAVDIPVSSLSEQGPIVAYRLDGAEMSVRDKGPLWIIYPYDLSEDYRSEVVYSRSIWQLDRIVVIK